MLKLKKECRLCKVYKGNKEREKYIVHLFETHGISLAIQKDRMKEKEKELIDWKLVDRLWREHGETGRKSAEKLFTKKG